MVQVEALAEVQVAVRVELVELAEVQAVGPAVGPVVALVAVRVEPEGPQVDYSNCFDPFFTPKMKIVAL